MTTILSAEKTPFRHNLSLLRQVLIVFPIIPKLVVPILSKFQRLHTLNKLFFVDVDLARIKQEADDSRIAFFGSIVLGDLFTGFVVGRFSLVFFLPCS